MRVPGKQIKNTFQYKGCQRPFEMKRQRLDNSHAGQNHDI